MHDLAERLDRDRLVEFTRELIRTPSPSKEERAVAAKVADEMRALGYQDVRVDRLFNVVGVVRGGRPGPRLLFNGHIDHAGVGEMVDPFSADIRDGADYGHQGEVIYGRGASDMKAGVAAMVQAGGLLVREAAGLRGELVVTCVAREEMARGEGIKFLLDGGLTADFAVSGEASGLSVYLGHRGKFEFRAVTHGRTTHAANPAGGVNAIYHMSAYIEALRAGFSPPEHPFLGRCSFAVLDISASPGALTPIVPDRCQAVIDRRFLPEETEESLLAEFDAVFRRLAKTEPGLKWELEPLKWFPAMYTDPEQPVVRAALAAREKVLGAAGEVGAWYFGVDGTFINQRGIPTVGFGPGNEWLAHTPGDVVPLAHLAPAALVYAELARLLLG